MLIQKFSKDAKRGFVVGANNFTPEKLAAGAVTLASGLMISVVGGLLKPHKKSHRAKGRDHKDSKKKPLWALALPLIYKAAKSAFKKKSLSDTLNGLTAQFAKEAQPEIVPEPDGIEVVDAIPISSEEEVYEHI